MWMLSIENTVPWVGFEIYCRDKSNSLVYMYIDFHIADNIMVMYMQAAIQLLGTGCELNHSQGHDMIAVPQNSRSDYCCAIELKVRLLLYHITLKVRLLLYHIILKVRLLLYHIILMVRLLMYHITLKVRLLLYHIFFKVKLLLYHITLNQKVIAVSCTSHCIRIDKFSTSSVKENLVF